MIEYKDEKSRELATQSIPKLMLKYAAPAIISMTAMSLYNICDSIFIGRGVGALAIAGLAICFPLMNVLAAFCSLTLVGSAAQVSVMMGANQRDDAQKIFGNMLRLEIVLGLAVTVLGLVFLDPLLVLFGATDKTLPYARDYMQISLLGTVFAYTFQGMSGQLRATGSPAQAMKAQIIALIFNLVLDVLFIFVFDWGIRGAAIATVIGQVFAFAYCVALFKDKSRYVYFTKEGFRYSWEKIKAILSIGVSPFLVSICGCIIVVFINRALIEQGGNDCDLYIGAYGIVNRITQFIIMAVAGFSSGLQPIIGFNNGAGLYKRIKETLYQSIRGVTIFMTLGYAFVASFPAALASLFTSDYKMIIFSVTAMRIALCTFPIIGMQMMSIVFFQAIRKPLSAIIISLTRQLLFLLPMLVILPEIWGVDGVWWSMAIADVLSVTLATAMLFRKVRNFKEKI